MDSILKSIFDKPKITLIFHYEDGILNFIVGTYPEYQKIVEAAISSQYPDGSIEITKKPKIFPRKYHDIMPLEPRKEGVFNLKTFKQQPDDPMNNIIDSM
jgi:hypothetical protein